MEKRRRRKAAAMATCCILRLGTIKFVIDTKKKDEVETLLFFSLVFALTIHWGEQLYCSYEKMLTKRISEKAEKYI